MNRQRTFFINEHEIAQILMASDSEDDDENIYLDDEDIAFLEQDEVLDSEVEVIIEDVVGERPPPLSASRKIPTPKKEKSIPLKWEKVPNMSLSNILKMKLILFTEKC